MNRTRITTGRAPRRGTGPRPRGRAGRPARGAGVLVTGLAVVATTACSGTAGTGGGAPPEPDAADFEGRGPITFVAGKDNSGNIRAVLDQWNAEHPGEEATFLELPDDPDSQRQQIIQNAETRSDAFTVVSVDAVWTSEFAAYRWIDRLPEEEFPLDEMLDPVVETARYRGGLYTVPSYTDASLLYYRTDLLERAGVAGPPTTWDELRDACARVLELPEARGMSCYAGQYEKYEGLSANFAEVVQSAGGLVTDDEGNPLLDTPEARAGLDFLVDSLRDGTIPRDAVTYQEEDTRRAFQSGNLVFARNWPYAYSLISATDGSSEVADRFDVAPPPGLDGPGSSSLGGWNLGISAHAENKATALDFIRFFTDQERSRVRQESGSQAPAYAALYEDPELLAEFPYLPSLRESIENAVPRPRVPRYGEVTAAVQNEVYAALTGSRTSAEALAALQRTLREINER